jgi:hypothetical protein
MALYDIKIQIEKPGGKVFILAAFVVSVAHAVALALRADTAEMNGCTTSKS